MFENAVVLLTAVEALVARAYRFIRAQVDAGQSLDDFQLAGYELAYCTAELAIAREYIHYAQMVRAYQGPTDAVLLEEKQALYYVAEAMHLAQGRLSARPADFGLDANELQATFFSLQHQQFRAKWLSTDHLLAIADALVAQQGATGRRILDREHQLMADTFRKVANDIVMPLAEEIHRKNLLIPDAIIQPLAELGCFGLSIRQRYGGIQPDEHEDTLGVVVVTEELARGSLCAAGSLITRPEIVSRALMAGGTEAQRQKWLPGIAAAKPLAAIAVTEPDFGSDVASVRCRATRTEGGWLINGAKTWCTMAGAAEVLLLLARTNPDPKAGHKGLSLFLVEKPRHDGEAFHVVQPNGGTLQGRAIPTVGYRGMHSFDMVFENYFVPAENLVGEEDGLGKGFYYQMAGFAGGRIQTAARAAGIMQAAYEKALQYAFERKVFGKAVGDYTLTRVKLAKIATLLNGCRQFTYAVAALMDKGEGQMEASLVKLFACKSSEWVCREAMQIHGGMGYAEESAVSRYFVDSRVLSIFEGAEETLALKVIFRAMVEKA